VDGASIAAPTPIRSRHAISRVGLVDSPALTKQPEDRGPDQQQPTAAEPVRENRYNLPGLSLAATGLVPMMLAAAAQSLPDLGILASSARLLRLRTLTDPSGLNLAAPESPGWPWRWRPGTRARFADGAWLS
jgi:hypothetical protein